MESENQTTDLDARMDAFRIGLEIGIRSADIVWRAAIRRERYISLVPVVVNQDLSDLLRTIKADGKSQ